jgi:nucleotide-binding universal stress UspA family protein
MSTPRRFRAVVALDDSEYAEIVLEHAIDQLMRHDNAELHLLRVVAREQDVEPAGRALALHALEGFETCGDRQGQRLARLHVRVGEPVDEILRLAADLDADLLIVGRFGKHRHRGHLLPTTLATKIVETAPCPVLVVGLTEHVVPAIEQCPACVAIRAQTNAETWFCSEHSGDPRLHSSALLPWSSGLTHDRLW